MPTQLPKVTFEYENDFQFDRKKDIWKAKQCGENINKTVKFGFIYRRNVAWLPWRLNRKRGWNGAKTINICSIERARVSQHVREPNENFQKFRWILWNKMLLSKFHLSCANNTVAYVRYARIHRIYFASGAGVDSHFHGFIHTLFSSHIYLYIRHLFFGKNPKKKKKLWSKNINANIYR